MFLKKTFPACVLGHFSIISFLSSWISANCVEIPKNLLKLIKLKI